MFKFSKDLLRDYFFDRLSIERSDIVKRWFVINGNDADMIKTLSVLWNEIPESIDSAKSQKAFDCFARRVEQTPYGDFRDVPRQLMRRMSSWSLRFAAMLTIPLAIFCIYLFEQSDRPKQWVELHVPYAQTKRVVLPDNSVVWLNAGSKIIYPKRFNRHIRQVFVVGEAYAEVAKDKSRPFYLSVGGVNVRVLGTKFNVKSFPEQSKTEVSLIEGSIDVDVEFNGFSRHFDMTPGNFMSFNHVTGEIESYQFSANDYLSWSDPKSGLYFRNMTLDEISRELERKFDVKIILRSEKIRYEKYFASYINNESLSDILTSLSVNNNFTVRRNGSVIDIYSSK